MHFDADDKGKTGRFFDDDKIRSVVDKLNSYGIKKQKTAKKKEGSRGKP